MLAAFSPRVTNAGDYKVLKALYYTLIWDLTLGQEGLPSDADPGSLSLSC